MARFSSISGLSGFDYIIFRLTQVQGQAAKGVPPLPGVGGQRPQDRGAAEQGQQRDEDHVQDGGRLLPVQGPNSIESFLL